MKNLQEIAEEIQEQVQNGASISDLMTILSDLRSDNFEECCKPLMKYLCENHHPHTKVLIDGNSAELLEGQRCYKNNEFIND